MTDVLCFPKFSQTFNGMKPMKFLSLFLSVALLGICFHESGRADLTVSIAQEGNNVVVRSEGSVDTGEFFLDFFPVGNPFMSGLVQPFESFRINASFQVGAGLIVGPNSVPGAVRSFDRYSLIYGFFDGPTFFARMSDSFGTPRVSANFGSGDTHGFFVQDRQLYLPTGYQSGDFLSGEITFVDTNLVELQILPGTYQWQTPNNTFTLTVAPPAITHVPITLEGNTAVSGVSDINGDGFDDVIVRMRGNPNLANVFSGVDRTVLHSLAGESNLDGSDFFGAAASGAGDVNGDGVPDLIVGASLDETNGFASGSARVFSGSDGSVLYTFFGDSAGDRFGDAVSGAGDVNGDGFDDLIVGARNDDNTDQDSGSVWVFSGIDGSVLYTFNGASFFEQLGFSVSGAGDINGDGFDDLIVGVPRDDANGPNAGSARVFSGLDGSVLYTFNGDFSRDRFGSSVSGAGDVNGDGVPDLIVGAEGDDLNPYFSVRARVFSGVDGAVLYSFPPSNFGEDVAVSGAGDVNGDGFDDLIVGEDDDNFGLSTLGVVRVFSGANGSLLYNLSVDPADDTSGRGRFGDSVSGAGDVNGDGIADFIVGADGFAQLYVSQDNRVLKGDVDLDGDVDFGDIPSFIAALQAGVFQAEADCDCSTVVDFADIPAFIAILQGQ